MYAYIKQYNTKAYNYLPHLYRCPPRKEISGHMSLSPAIIKYKVTLNSVRPDKHKKYWYHNMIPRVDTDIGAHMINKHCRSMSTSVATISINIDVTSFWYSISQTVICAIKLDNAIQWNLSNLDPTYPILSKLHKWLLYKRDDCFIRGVECYLF